MPTYSMNLVKEILSTGSIEKIKEDLGFIVTVLRDNDEKVSVKAGAEYQGFITNVGRDFFWITEDNYKTEEKISFADFEGLILLS